MDNIQYSNLLHINEASKQGRLVVFVGAGVSANSGVPVWSNLIDEMKKECNLTSEKDDLKVAQLYKDARGDKEYLDKVKDVLKHNKTIPNEIHKDILALKPCHIITTNYDNLLEQEIENEYSQFAIVREDKDLPNILYQNSVVKMHGDFDTNNIVLTESDYYNYSKNFSLIRSFVISLFASKLVMFVGFSFADLNLKMILNDVHSVLKDSMQRAYLITENNPDVLTIQYYGNKGINIIHIDEKNLDEILASSEEFSSSTLTNSKGIYLHKILNCIRIVRKNPNYDLASMLYAKLKSYNDEIKDLGEGLKYFIPKEELQTWNPYSGGLQISSSYFRKLSEQLKSFAGKKKFLKEHPEIDRTLLKRMAHDNYLYRIDDVEILDSKLIYNMEKNFDTPYSTSYLYKMDFNMLIERLNFLSSRELSCNADDLEYPFTLYKLGRYYEAYQIYNCILRNAWKSRKYILYFICLYNIWSIRGGIYFQMMSRKDLDGNTTYKKLCDIDLDDALRRLPIEEEIRKVFQDLLSSRAIGMRAAETDNLKEQIHQQRKSGERGGVSINSNIARLLSKFQREFRFCNNNFTICDNSKQYETICYNTVTGILNSYATPCGKFDGIEFGTTKIDEIFSLCVFTFIFCMDNYRLRKIFAQYEIGKMKFSQDAIKLLNGYLEKLSKTHNIPFADGAKFANYIQNVFFVISKMENDGIHIDLLYNVVLKYWSYLQVSVNERNLDEIICRYEPSKDSLLRIANNLMEITDDNNRFVYCFKYIAYYMNKQRIEYESFDMNKIRSLRNIDGVCFLYSVIPSAKRDEFSIYCQQKIRHTCFYFEFIADNNLKVDSTEHFKEMIEKIRKTTSDDISFCYQKLSEIYSSGQNPEVKQMIENIAVKNECMKFYLSPKEYYDKSNINPEWLLYMNKSTIQEIVKIKEYKDVLKQYLSDNRFISHEKRMMIINLL